jgi:hypothetical protein
VSLLFISYKRSNEINSTARDIHAYLNRHFGDGSVFLDEASIQYGEDIGQTIREKLSQCDVFVVLIDKNWKRCMSERDFKDSNLFRYPSPSNEWIGKEVEEVLRLKNIHPFPVLLDGTEMPRRYDLPEKVRDIVLAKAIPFRISNQSEDFPRLVRELEKYVKGSVRPISNSDGSIYDKYVNEVRYCIESGDGDLNDISQAYLREVANYVRLNINIDLSHVNEQVRQPYFSYREILERSIEQGLRERSVEELFIKGEAKKYLNRLHLIFDIPAWKARQLESKALEGWKFVAQEYSGFVRETIELGFFRQHSNQSRLESLRQQFLRESRLDSWLYNLVVQEQQYDLASNEVIDIQFFRQRLIYLVNTKRDEIERKELNLWAIKVTQYEKHISKILDKLDQFREVKDLYDQGIQRLAKRSVTSIDLLNFLIDEKEDRIAYFVDSMIQLFLNPPQHMTLYRSWIFTFNQLGYKLPDWQVQDIFRELLWERVNRDMRRSRHQEFQKSVAMKSR